MCLLLFTSRFQALHSQTHFETTLERRPEGRGSRPAGKLREADSPLHASSPFPARPGGHPRGLRSWCHEAQCGERGTDQRADGFRGVSGTVPTVLPRSTLECFGRP